MKRSVASLLLIFSLVGCQSTPKPSLDVLAPFGSPRVPPPGTTNYGAKGSYYNGNGPASTAPAGAAPTTGLPATPNSATPGISAQRSPQAALPSNQTVASNGQWRTPNATASPNAVQPAAYNADMTAALATQTPVGTGVLPAAAATPAKSTLKLNGQPVTDATTSAASAEPAKFQPAPGATEISQLPRTGTVAAPTAVSKEVVATAQASDQAKPAAPTTPATDASGSLTWRTRPVATSAGN